jgi:hypothetical protein
LRALLDVGDVGFGTYLLGVREAQMSIGYDIIQLPNGSYRFSKLSASGELRDTLLLARSDLRFYMHGPVLQRALGALDSTRHAQVIFKGKKRKKKSRSVWTVGGGLPETNRRRH